jgi:hypothetical protein
VHWPLNLKPSGIEKYDGSTNLAKWLEVYQLTIEAVGGDLSDASSILQRPLVPPESTKTCPIFLRSIKKGSPLTPSREINMLKATMHPINFCMSWRLSGGFHLVIADTFFGLGSIPRWEPIYLSNFLEGTPNVHFLGFNFILNFLRLLNVSARSEMSPSSSRVFTTTSSIYASVLHPSYECRYHCIPHC